MSAVPSVDPSDPKPTRQQRREWTTRAFAAAAKARSTKKREQLEDYVIQLNMDVARSVASRYFERGIEQEDLLQVAYTALTRAARDFDPNRHDDFLSYAVPTIRGEIKKHFRDRGWTVRPPRRIQELQGRIQRAQGDLAQRLGQSPRPSEIAEELDADLRDVVEAMSADGCFTPSSLDQPVTNGEGGRAAAVGELLGENDAAQPAVEARATLAAVVPQLKPRDRQILYMRFFEECTQQEIADEIGVTQMQVSRLLGRIMRDLHTQLADESASPVAPAG
jgi:RNA polymerase sigma-B factor